MVAPGGPHNPVARAVQRAEHGARLTSLPERLEAGRERLGLAAHAPAVFSNEALALEEQHQHMRELEELAHPHHHNHQGGSSHAAALAAPAAAPSSVSGHAEAPLAEASSGGGEAPARKRGRPPKPAAEGEQAAQQLPKQQPLSEEAAHAKGVLVSQGLSAAEALRLLGKYPSLAECQHLGETLPRTLGMLCEALGGGGESLTPALLLRCADAAEAPQLLCSSPGAVQLALECLSVDGSKATAAQEPAAGSGAGEQQGEDCSVEGSCEAASQEGDGLVIQLAKLKGIAANIVARAQQQQQYARRRRKV